MATSAVSGLVFGFYLGANKVAEVTDAKLTVGGKTVDATSVDSAGWEECLAGLRNAQFTVNGMLIIGDTTGFIALQTALLGGTSVSCKLRSTAAGYNWSATCIMTNGQFSMDLNNPQKISWTLKATGAVTPAAS